MKESQITTVSPSEIEVIKKTIAADATEAELNLYLFDCARHGVHPLDKLLHFTKRGGKYVPVTSIDLMRIRAHDTGECLGISDPKFSGAEKGEDFAATCTVTRMVKKERAEFTATARWPEYYPGDGGVGIMWRKMPHTLLGKCAEALALRKGFPRSLAGLYAKEEMDQAHSVSAPPLVTHASSLAKPPEPEKPVEKTFTDLIVQATEDPREGKPSVYVIAFAGGQVTKTLSRDLYGLANDWMVMDRACEAKIRPGRLPKSWELIYLEPLAEAQDEPLTD